MSLVRIFLDMKHKEFKAAITNNKFYDEVDQRRSEGVKKYSRFEDLKIQEIIDAYHAFKRLLGKVYIFDQISLQDMKDFMILPDAT
jgi:type I restriction-modification system DNA methylase subunit